MASAMPLSLKNPGFSPEGRTLVPLGITDKISFRAQPEHWPSDSLRPHTSAESARPEIESLDGSEEGAGRNLSGDADAPVGRPPHAAESKERVTSRTLSRRPINKNSGLATQAYNVPRS